MKTDLFLAFLGLAAAGAAPPQADPDARLPADVRGFVAQWEGCAHWLGEPPWDKARARQIEQAVRKVCPGVDARGRKLRRKYARNRAIRARLAEYEPLHQ